MFSEVISSIWTFEYCSLAKCVLRTPYDSNESKIWYSMCEIVVTRGFILLLLGEAKSESEIEFFSKCLTTISDKLRQIVSNQIQLYLSYIPQDISPYKQGDPIALEWELISEAEECSSYLCDKMCRGSRNQTVTSLTLPQLTSVLHGLLDEGTNKLGGGVLLDLIIIISSSGVDQLIEGQDALGIYGALERVGWQNGHVTVMHCLQIESHLLISPAVHTSVVMSEDEKLECIDENLFWRGVFIADFNAFDSSGREKQIRHLCIRKEPGSVAGDKCDEKKSGLFRKKKVSRKERKGESPFMVLFVKEMVQDNFPLIWLQPRPIKLYSLDKQGQLALKSMRAQLSSVVGEEGSGAFILLALVSCHLDTPLLTDTWYEYIIGKQSHWINSVKIEMLNTPNYSLFPQSTVSEEALYIFEFKQDKVIPDEVVEGSIALREENLPEDISIPEEISMPALNEQQLYTVCDIWRKLFDLQVPPEADSLSDELESKIDNILLDMPVPSIKTISTSAPPTESDSVKELKDTLEYKMFSALDRYSQLMENSAKSPMRTLGGLSPPPMTQSSSKMGVDSLLECFDSEGQAVQDLEEVPIPDWLDREQMKERLFSNAIDGEDANQSCIQYSWDRCPTHLVKHETRGLMNYESPPKSRLAKSLFPSKPKSDKPIPVPLNFSGLTISNDKCDESVSIKVRSSSKTCANSSKSKVKVRVNKSMTEVRARKSSGKKESRDKELRSLLERAVVKALKGENLTRDHPQFKAAYTQLFNVCKCFLSGMEFEIAKEKVEQLTVNNAKQVVELQTNT